MDLNAQYLYAGNIEKKIELNKMVHFSIKMNCNIKAKLYLFLEILSV